MPTERSNRHVQYMDWEWRPATAWLCRWATNTSY